MSNDKFKFLPDIATADLAFEAYGSTYSELFENAGLALEEAMVKLDTIEPKESHTINKEEDSIENLLLSFLEELVYLKDAEAAVFNRIKCEVQRLRAPSHPAQRKGSSWDLKAKLTGEKN